jgi:hypothetical protein
MNAGPGESPSDGDDPTTAEVACFEAGIKFGSLYHQFAGTPVSPDSAPSLAAAMEAAIENQPHCRNVTVEVDTDAIRAAIDGSHGYTELTGSFLAVAIDVDYEGTQVRAEMAMQDGYPLMEVAGVRRD